jgi:hypothetical protein
VERTTSAVAAHRSDITGGVVSWHSLALLLVITGLKLAPAARLRGRNLMELDVVESGLMLTAAVLADGDAMLVVLGAVTIEGLVSAGTSGCSTHRKRRSRVPSRSRSMRAGARKTSGRSPRSRSPGSRPRRSPT